MAALLGLISVFLRLGRRVHRPSVSLVFYFSCSWWLSPHFHRKFGVRIAQERRLATRSTHSTPFCLSCRETLLVFFPCYIERRGNLRGCQGRRRRAAFILTLDSPASYFIIELGTKRNAVQWSFVPYWSGFRFFWSALVGSQPRLWHSPSSSFSFRSQNIMDPLRTKSYVKLWSSTAPHRCRASSMRRS